jgi:hypothetical protein
MPTILDRFKRSWNVFFGRDPTGNHPATYGREYDFGPASAIRPDRMRFTRNNAQTLIASVYNRISVDVASIEFKHVRVDQNGTYKADVNSFLNDCLKYEANIDQTSRAFIQDIVQSMFDEGCVAVVPIDCDTNNTRTKVSEAKVYTLRTGKVVAWYPTAVKVNIYNDRTGRREEIIVPKSLCAIVENPFYSIMNEPNSTLQRLLRTIRQLDTFNDANASNKLNMIIQLPYVIKSQLRREEANRRRDEMEDQLMNSKYGVAYADGTERIIQLNRPLENNLWQQVKELSEQLYNQLGLTATIFDGTADEQTMINYNNRTIEPICAAITQEFERKFLTITARSQGQAIRYFRDPFKLVPVSQVADMADKFTRNEIMTSNEFRVKIGLLPSNDPKADELRNSNLNQSNEEIAAQTNNAEPMEETNNEETSTVETEDAEANSESSRVVPNDASFEDMEKFIQSYGR